VATEKELEDLVSKERQTGVYLTCLGVGMGNYKDSKMETLAKKGNGNFAYLDDIKEGEKVLVKELTQNLYTVSNEVSLGVVFNPVMVKEYRLVGYDNKKNALSDSTNILEGGEVGSANGTTAIFEIVPTEENIFSEPFSEDEIASVKVNYKLPEDTLHKSMTYLCPNNFEDFRFLGKDLRFASAVTMFGLMLRNSSYAKVSWSDIDRIARDSANPNDYLQNEFILLVEKARKMYPKRNKKK